MRTLNVVKEKGRGMLIIIEEEGNRVRELFVLSTFNCSSFSLSDRLS